MYHARYVRKTEEMERGRVLLLSISSEGIVLGGKSDDDVTRGDPFSRSVGDVLARTDLDSLGGV